MCTAASSTWLSVALIFSSMKTPDVDSPLRRSRLAPRRRAVTRGLQQPSLSSRRATGPESKLLPVDGRESKGSDLGIVARVGWRTSSREAMWQAGVGIRELACLAGSPRTNNKSVTIAILPPGSFAQFLVFEASSLSGSSFLHGRWHMVPASSSCRNRALGPGRWLAHGLLASIDSRVGPLDLSWSARNLRGFRHGSPCCPSGHGCRTRFRRSKPLHISDWHVDVKS